MTAIATTCIWCALQVSLFVAVVSLLYLLLRRWSLAAGGLIAAVSLAVVILISGLAFSPWPRWELATAGANLPKPQTSIPITESELATAPETVATAPTVTSHPPEAPQAGIAAWLTGFGDALTHELTVPADVPATHAWTWTEIAVVVCLALSALGCVRLLAGLWAVRALRKAGRPIEDDALRESADLLRAELACPRRVELLEADQLAAPATVGWRRPVILLPAAWRSWTPLERRAVLAHEIAHIRRGDFLTYVIAQIGLVLHYYNPLVHWLAGRLRLEQELAADASAAALAGGRLEYLQMLAAMALRQADQPVSWPARTFLPSRGHLIRRVEMLKHSKRLSTRLPGAARVVVVGLLAAVGIGVVGLREPQRPAAAMAAEDQTEVAEAQDRTRATQPQSDKFELSFVPQNTMAIIGIRPAALFGQPEMAPLAKMYNEDLGLQKAMGIPVEEIEQITGVTLARKNVGEISPADMRPQPKMAIGTTLIRTVRPNEFKTLIATSAPEAEQKTHAGETYYKSAKSGICYFRPDDRSILMDFEENLRQFLESGPGVKAAFVQGEAWRTAAAGHAVIAFDSGATSRELAQTLKNSPIVPGIAPLWEQSKSLIVFGKYNGSLAIEGIAGCGDAEAATAVQKTLEAWVTLMTNMLNQFSRQLDKKLVDAGLAYLDGAQVSSVGTNVRISSSATLKLELLAGVIVPAIAVGRTEVRQDDDHRKKLRLKGIALAMHNYHDANGHFPPAVVLGPDGKTPHSWRVALLPYLGDPAAAQLFGKYKFDEPWDSEHNKTVIKRIPEVYRRDADSTNAAYFVLTGPGTPFGKKEGVRFQDIFDGTANTLMIVEAKRNIPWTKPEDIPYDPAAPLPKLGGYTPNGILAAKFDGSVTTVPAQGIPEKLWHATISHQGGEYESGDIFRTNDPKD